MQNFSFKTEINLTEFFQITFFDIFILTVNKNLSFYTLEKARVAILRSRCNVFFNALGRHNIIMNFLQVRIISDDVTSQKAAAILENRNRVNISPCHFVARQVTNIFGCISLEIRQVEWNYR